MLASLTLSRYRLATSSGVRSNPNLSEPRNRSLPNRLLHHVRIMTLYIGCLYQSGAVGLCIVGTLRNDAVAKCEHCPAALAESTV
jgi:hypothetical protein